MTNTLNIIIQKGDKTHREVFELPKLTVDEYDSSIHWGKVVSYPDTDTFNLEENFVYIWKTASPENDEERKQLEETGKMGFIKLRDL